MEIDLRPISKLCQSPGNIQPVQYLVWFQFPLHISAKTCILPIQDSSSGEMVKSEQSAMSCGVTMAGKALLIPQQTCRQYTGETAAVTLSDQLHPSTHVHFQCCKTLSISNLTAFLAVVSTGRTFQNILEHRREEIYIVKLS